MSTYEDRRERRRRFVRRNLLWIIPAGLAVAALFVYCLGDFVVWLWRVTLVDIFAIKPISFWQAWGLILLSQILFKGNIQPMMRTRPRWRGGPACGDAPGMQGEKT